MTALEKLQKKTSDKKHICVGLDSDFAKLPESVKEHAFPVHEFNRRIIEATKKEAAAYKINLAFYEVLGRKGWEILEKTLADIPEDVLVIADAKRGDIGNTSRMYASAFFDTFGFDSITLHPYMGIDSVKPFLDYQDKLSFILALTSNKSNEDFEKLELKKGGRLFQELINKVHEWNEAKNAGIVFGATNPEELDANTSLIGQLPVLLPGVGAQEGDLGKVLGSLKKGNISDFIINVSRGLIFADNSDNFDETAGTLLKEYNKKIESHYY